MKKIYVFIAVIASVVMSVSCEGRLDHDPALNGNRVSFTVGSGKTKSSEGSMTAGNTMIPFWKAGDCTELFLEESLSSSDVAFVPWTKGTPAYTENVASLYGSFKAYACGTRELDAVFTYGRGVWSHTYADVNPWAVANPIKYWMHMPADMTGTGVGSLACEDGGTISFEYDSPAKAVDQSDILFTTKSFSRRDHDLGNNHLLFYHALTGVKFATGNLNDGTRITKVEFIGLHGRGSCSITPNYLDNVNTASGNISNKTGLPETRSSQCVSWAYSDADKTKNRFSQEFSGTVSYENDGKFGSGFYSAAADNNLNDADASQTFWFIPQVLDEDVKLKVSFIFNGEEYEQTIDFGNLAGKNGSGHVEWKAGELRTYTLKATAAGISVTDKVDGMTKDHVVITNTGTCETYIRAAVVANWCDPDGEIIAPWTDMVTPCPDWTLNPHDGYYYYIKALKPGAATGQPLFDRYSYSTEDKSVSIDGITVSADHLEMDISVQAVKRTGYASYREAWQTEAGVIF